MYTVTMLYYPCSTWQVMLQSDTDYDEDDNIALYKKRKEIKRLNARTRWREAVFKVPYFYLFV